MARRGKSFIPNGVYFITFTILDWVNIFISDKYINFVYRWFDYMRSNYDNKIHAYVIMSNHIHAIIKVSYKSPKLSILIMNAKRFLAYQIVRELKKDGNLEALEHFTYKARINDNALHRVFTNRYDSLLILNRKFFLQKLNYIHNNPCKSVHSFVKNPEDYKHSSASNYLEGKGFYNVDVVEF